MDEQINAKNYLQRLFINEAKGSLYRITGDTDISDDRIATDEEVEEVIDAVFE